MTSRVSCARPTPPADDDNVRLRKTASKPCPSSPLKRRATCCVAQPKPPKPPTSRPKNSLATMPTLIRFEVSLEVFTVGACGPNHPDANIHQSEADATRQESFRSCMVKGN